MAFARLVLLLFLIGLTASRFGLLLHELAGHAGVALSFGCRVDGVRLFTFGGGYVQTACESLSLGALLAIDVAGIAWELAAGGLLLAAARGRRDLLGLFLAGAGLLFVLHAIFYAVAGVHYGVGDGRRLHLLLGDRRTVPLVIGSLTLLAATFFCARVVGRRLAADLPGPGRTRRVATLAIAGIAAAALHGSLLLVERRLVADAAYAASFTPEPRLRRPPQRPEPAIPSTPSEATSAPAEDPGPEAETPSVRPAPGEPAVFPLRSVLGVGMALATLLGFSSALRRTRAIGDPAALGDAPALVRAGAACAIAVATVLAFDRLL